MNKLAIALCLSLLLAVPGTGLAASKGSTEYDMGKMTCKDIFTDPESVTFMLFWIDGYLSHKNNNMMFSEASIKEIGEALTDECKENPNKMLGNIIKGW